MPVIAVCSHDRHKSGVFSATEANALDVDNGDTVKALSIFTSESHITTPDDTITVAEMGLQELAINGIPDIFAVYHEVLSNLNIGRAGRNAIFSSASHWRQSVHQSERGMAAFLSSLRVFSAQIAADKMAQDAQDAVLHLFDLLTRFPPAVRTLYILMSGKTPSAPQCAALAQAVFEVLKSIVPAHIVRSDSGRFFEGARLFFGSVLENAKDLKLPEENPWMPYLNSMRTIDLRDTDTMEFVIKPVTTTTGLVETGHFDALKPDGILTAASSDLALTSLETDCRTKRAALLNGGRMAELVVFDADSLRSQYRYKDKGNLEKVMLAQEFSDTNHLSVLCTRANFVVLKPSNLTSAEPPALTLD